MPEHVRRSICSKRLSRGQQRYGADADWSVLNVVHIGATWRICLNCCGDDAALCQITLTTLTTCLVIVFVPKMSAYNKNFEYFDNINVL